MTSPATLFITVVIVCFLVHRSSCDLDPSLTVENANRYIAENKDSIDQRYRLKYHAMAPIGWINDPNGFIFYRNEYHLFYQYNPYNASANKIHWGHVKSKDLVEWEDLPVALAPDHDYDADGVFSGTSIEKDGKLYVMYTGNSGNRQVQCIAVSEDGIHFQKIEQNPVLDASQLPSNAQPQDFRDPKVFKRGRLYYVVTVSRTVNETGQVLLHQSKDLISWKFKSILLQGSPKEGNMWECPDLFELDGKDVLMLSAIEMPRSGNDYRNYDSVIAYVGKVDWKRGKFNVETVKELDHGMDFYATQTISDGTGRRVMTAWMNMWNRSYPSDVDGWVGAMILPRELHISDNYLVQSPIPEISRYYEKVAQYSNVVIINRRDRIFHGVKGEVGKLEVQVHLRHASVFTIKLRGNGGNESTVVSYHTRSKQLVLDRSNSGVTITGHENPPVSSRQVTTGLINNRLKLELFLDQSSIEVFANDGRESLTATIFPTKLPSSLITFTVKGIAVVENLSFYNINV